MHWKIYIGFSLWRTSILPEGLAVTRRSTRRGLRYMCRWVCPGFAWHSPLFWRWTSAGHARLPWPHFWVVPRGGAVHCRREPLPGSTRFSASYFCCWKLGGVYLSKAIGIVVVVVIIIIVIIIVLVIVLVIVVVAVVVIILVIMTAIIITRGRGGY